MMKKLRSALPHILFAIYLAALLRLTVVRDSVLSGVLLSGKLNLSPFTAYLQLLSWGSYYHAAYLFFGNIFWFMPLGLYLKRQKWPFLPALLCGFLLSFMIEALQYILGCGVTETDDLILNTLGTALGFLLGLILRSKKAAG